MDIHVDIRRFLEIHAWICNGFSDQGLHNRIYSCEVLISIPSSGIFTYLTCEYYINCPFFLSTHKCLQWVVLPVLGR